MRRVSVAQARQRLADLLDAAEKGEPAIIERQGVRFALRVEAPKRARRGRKPLIEHVDPALEAGDWSWSWAPGGLRLRARRRARR